MKINIFPAGTKDEEVNKFMAGVDILEFLRDGGAVSEPYQLDPQGNMIFKYLEKGISSTKQYHVDRLNDQILSLQGKRMQAGLNLRHAAAVDKAHRGGKLKQLKAAENLALCEREVENIDFDIKSKKGLLQELEVHGFNEFGELNTPAITNDEEAKTE